MSNESVRLKAGDVRVGQALSWPVFDRAGKLLLRQGYVIASQRQLDLLIERGLFRQLTEEEKARREAPAPTPEKTNPFDVIRDSTHRLEQILGGIEAGNPQIEERILRLVRDLIAVCHDFPDAALGAIHLCHDAAYSLWHPVHQACLAALIGERLEMAAGRVETLVAAALTANVSMRKLQDQLHQRREPLSEQQRAEVNRHPTRSVALLEGAGIRNRTWLDIVLQHHERINGSGYPGGVAAEGILEEARILGIVDHYTAVVTARGDRAPLSPQDQLRALFLQRGQDFDETASLALIKELGVFPPGTFVRLASGEVGVVIHRNNGIQPIVSALISPRGGAYARPLRRDSAAHEYSIQESVRWQNEIPLNLSLAWDYN